MVGNDIVDLKHAALESNWQRSRFLNKVFTQNEQHYISESNQPHKMVWRLWSMKESAYKIHVQDYQNRFFNPIKLDCKILDDEQGVVKINNTPYITTSFINNRFIHTMATIKAGDIINNEFFRMDDSSYKGQHETCKIKVKEAVSQWRNIDIESVEIRKNIIGIPELYNNGKSLKISCTISHHGNYGAFAIH